jgi:hypothetical protein
MKKIFALLVAIVLLSVAVFPASAASKDELLEAFKEVSISKRVMTDLENLASAYDITEEQGDRLMVLVGQLKEALPEDKGPGYANPDGNEDYFGTEKYPYTEEQLDKVMGIIAEACDVLGFTYDFIASEDPKHPGDIKVVFYDSEGRLAYQYDGDLIKKTDVVEEESESSVLLLVGGISVIALAGACVVLKKKEQ